MTSAVVKAFNYIWVLKEIRVFSLVIPVRLAAILV